MPHVSQKKLKKDIFVKMSKALIETIANTRSKKETKMFLKELLTPTEQIMLAKRLAVIVMIHKGYSFLVIEKVLKVSPSTINRFRRETKLRTFHTIVQRIKKDKKQQEFWRAFEEGLRLGMPPMVGRGRWKYLRDL